MSPRSLPNFTASAPVRRVAVAAAVCALTVTGCAGDSRDGQTVTLTVFAAASLTDVFTEFEQQFEQEHPGVNVVLSTGGSSDLVAQMAAGAPADVFACADEATMAKAQDQDLIADQPVTFATNELTIAVQPGNPHQIDSLADLAGEGLDVVRCAAPVPCGSVADAVLEDAGVSVRAASEENSVTDVLGKVTSGEADAGLVYVTDIARADGQAEQVEIPEAAQHRTNYPISVTHDSAHGELAQEFIDVVTGPAGEKALKNAGFGIP